ncbi:MAG: carbohydrate ABC transporter permease [Phycisphaeraceae bacterium]|nr:MAG: carbohydrate ABC transporter permease [Phycisphaeraceae bacterium]
MIDRRPPMVWAWWYAVAAVLVCVAVGPAAYLVLASVATRDASGGVSWSFAAYASAWRDGKLGGPLVNSILVTAARAALNVIIAAMAAYPLARMRFRGRDTVFVLLLATMMIPEQVVVVPMFRTVVGLGLFDTLAAVVVPFSVTALGIYLCRQAFAQIPMEMEEAARMDGAGSLRVWWHVMLPLSAPTLSTLALFSVIGAWSDLLWPLIVLQSREHATLPVAISGLMGQFATDARVAYAASVLALVPIVLVLAAAQRFMRSDVLGGAVKG